MRYVTGLARRKLLCSCLSLLVLCPILQTTALAKIETWGFPVGEQLVYRVSWGAIPVGEATVTTSWKEGHEGELLRLHLHVRSNRAIAVAYPVRIDIESIVRVDDFLPVRHHQRRREGRRRAEVEVIFDHEKGVAIQRELLRDREDTIELEADTRDIFTFLYYVRRYPMELGNRSHYRVLTDDKIYDLWLDVAEEAVDVRTILDDRVSAFEVEPEAAFEGVFRRHGSLELQVSRDARQLMLFMRANVPIGSVRAVLEAVNGPGCDVWGR